MAAALGVVGAGRAEIVPPAGGDGDLRAIDGAGLVDTGMAAPRGPGADGSSAGVATVPGGGVTIARVSVGKGAPQATSTRVQLNVRRTRTRLPKPTVSYRKAGLSHAVPSASCLENSGDG